MKGILLAGGSGTRLYPMTTATTKQLLPIYDKPLLYYPLTLLMMAGIRDILIISSPEDLPQIQRLLGDGSMWGLRLAFREQPSPDGIAQAFHIAESWIAGEPCALALGDNIVYGHGLMDQLQTARKRAEAGTSTLFAYRVADPERFGIAVFDDEGRIQSLEEKPQVPLSDWAVIGLYFYDSQACTYARQLKPSARGEYEITDLNAIYVERGALCAQQLGRGYAWLDAGTPDSMLQAAQFVQTLQQRQGLQIGSPEEVALRMGYIGKDDLKRWAQPLIKTQYGRYLLDLTDGRV